MKKSNLLSTLAAAAILCIATATQAAIHRINFLSNYDLNAGTYGENYGGNSANPVYDQLASAVGSPFVSDYDTLYLEGSPTGQSYTGIALTRPFTIIGTGYFLSFNPNTSNDLLDSKLEYITFSSSGGSSSSGSQIIGVNFTSQFGATVNESNITIKRCYFNAVAEVHLDYNLSDINILQNFFDNSPTSPNTVTGITFNQFGGVNDLIINYNIFKRTIFAASNNSATGGNTYTVLECKNNTFDCPAVTGGPSIRMDCASFHNNIIKVPSVTLNINSGIASGSITNNTGSSVNQFDYSATYNNKQVTNMTTLFITPGTSTDGNYQLQPGVANNYAGLGGGDRGAYGGTIPGNRYTLSGLAAIPVIYDVFTTGTASGGNLPVTIKACTIK